MAAQAGTRQQHLGVHYLNLTHVHALICNENHIDHDVHPVHAGEMVGAILHTDHAYLAACLQCLQHCGHNLAVIALDDAANDVADVEARVTLLAPLEAHFLHAPVQVLQWR